MPRKHPSPHLNPWNPLTPTKESVQIQSFTSHTKIRKEITKLHLASIHCFIYFLIWFYITHYSHLEFSSTSKKKIIETWEFKCIYSSIHPSIHSLTHSLIQQTGERHWNIINICARSYACTLYLFLLQLHDNPVDKKPAYWLSPGCLPLHQIVDLQRATQQTGWYASLLVPSNSHMWKLRIREIGFLVHHHVGFSWAPNVCSKLLFVSVRFPKP